MPIETPETPASVESTKPSKLSRLKSTALTAGVLALPTVITVGTSLLGYKVAKMHFDAAKLNLETAQINHP